MTQVPRSFVRGREFLREEYQRAFRHDRWNIGIADGPISRFLEPDAQVEVRWLSPPERGTYRADPFGIVRGNATEIFFEEYEFQSDKGVISHIRETPGGALSESKVVMNLPVHASYPFLFEQAGSVYCIPETAHAGEIGLYRATEFPQGWTKAATLVPGVAGTDPTLIEHEGLLWLLCTDLRDGAFSKLRIWYASDLFGPWTPHPRNPVKTDLCSARPGGTPFRVGGELYRPAQDCSSSYGGSITINRIVELTEDEYREEPVVAVGPFPDSPYAHGLHTLSAIGDRTLVDGKRVGFSRSLMRRNLQESVRERWPRVFQGQLRGREPHGGLGGPPGQRQPGVGTVIGTRAPRSRGESSNASGRNAMAPHGRADARPTARRRGSDDDSIQRQLAPAGVLARAPPRLGDFDVEEAS